MAFLYAFLAVDSELSVLLTCAIEDKKKTGDKGETYGNMFHTEEAVLLGDREAFEDRDHARNYAYQYDI